MTYTFVHTEQVQVISIQERFFEIFYEQDANLNHEARFYNSCNQFVEEYKLRPPYTNYSSFKTSMSNRSNGKQKK